MKTYIIHKKNGKVICGPDNESKVQSRVVVQVSPKDTYLVKLIKLNRKALDDKDVKIHYLVHTLTHVKSELVDIMGKCSYFDGKVNDDCEDLDDAVSSLESANNRIDTLQNTLDSVIGNAESLHDNVQFAINQVTFD